jgi:hypothetical protein
VHVINNIYTCQHALRDRDPNAICHACRCHLLMWNVSSVALKSQWCSYRSVVIVIDPSIGGRRGRTAATCWSKGWINANYACQSWLSLYNIILCKGYSIRLGYLSCIISNFCPSYYHLHEHINILSVWSLSYDRLFVVNGRVHWSSWDRMSLNAMCNWYQKIFVSLQWCMRASVGVFHISTCTAIQFKWLSQWDSYKFHALYSVATMDS